MMREINYLSFGAPNEIEIQRQLEFCRVISGILNAKFNFYLFLFPDDEEWNLDGLTIIRLDYINHFFDKFRSRIEDTLIVNHGFFLPYIEDYLTHENGATIYHKIDVEYVFMKKIGLDPEDYNQHRKIEVELQSRCDWLYTSSEILIQYLMDNDGYHQHRYSLIPAMSILRDSKINLEVGANMTDKIQFVHIGPVSNRGIKYIKKILNVQGNYLTVVSDETTNLLKQGFTKNERFQIVSFTSNNIQKQLTESDYCLFRPKPDISSWLRVEPFIFDCIRRGLKLIVPREYKTGLMVTIEQDLLILEDCDFKLPKLSLAARLKNQERYEETTCFTCLENEIKFRNLKNIHDRRVTK